MRVALVVPKWTNTLGRFDFLAQLMVVHYPLNVAILAKYIEKYGNEVEIIDGQAEQLSNSEITNMILKKGFDLVGYSVTSPLYNSVLEIASNIKRDKPNIKQIIGGAHINVLQKDAYNDCFDFLVFGEAEETIVELLDYLNNRSFLTVDTIEGIIYKNKSGDIVQNKPRKPINNLDEIEFQAAHLVNLGKYSLYEGANKKSKGYVSIMASRGCPYKCAFCAEPLNNRGVRFRSPENIVKEMDFHFSTLNVRHFFFVDSCLTLNRDQILRLCNLLSEKKLPITWSGWTRVNLVDEELLFKMKKTGFIVMSMGVESADPQILKNIKKDITVQQIKNAFMLAKKLKIESFCSAMIGLPGETRISAWKTIKFIRNTPEISYSTFSIATPYPGTEMNNWLLDEKFGMKFLDRDNSSKSRWGYSAFKVNDLEPKDLVTLQRWGLFWIHFTPQRIIYIYKMLGFKNFIKLILNFFRLSS
ncbi:MAG: radical SAM protein [Candidatus Omnitrophota bacterium]